MLVMYDVDDDDGEGVEVVMVCKTMCIDHMDQSSSDAYFIIS